MADESPVQNLCEETTCPICLEYFTEPVIIDCGHNFCQACITQSWEKLGSDASCPQCREPCQQRNFRPNRQLANIVQIAKKFHLQMLKGVEVQGSVCERHQESLKLFCEDDQVPICVVCDKSKEHREHKVIPKEEAFAEYQGKIMSRLECLKKHREQILSSKLNGETKSQNLLKQTEMESQKIVVDFKQLDQFLEEQKCLLLAQLKKLCDGIKNCRNQYIAKLSEEMASLDNLIKQLEEKQKQPVTEFLQDMRIIQERCNENENRAVDPIAFPPELEEQLEKFLKMHPFLENAAKEFKDMMLVGLQEKKGEDMTIPKLFLAAYGQATAQVTYGQASTQGMFGTTHAQPFASVFSNATSVNRSELRCYSYVMGVERITSGTRSWIVNVGNEKLWAVGIVKESLRRCNINNLNTINGIWAIGRTPNGGYFSSTSPGITLGPSLLVPHFSRVLNPKDVLPKRIRVSVNYEAGLVTFYDADSDKTFFTFNASFSGEGICSWLCVG